MTEQEFNAKVLEKFPADRNWFDDYTVENGAVVIGNKTQYVVSTLEGLIKSVVANQTLAVMDAGSGLLATQCKTFGASEVTAMAADAVEEELCKELATLTNVPLTVVAQKVLVFDGDNVLVDQDYAEGFDYMYIQGSMYWKYWNMVKDFDILFEGFSYFVKKGLFFDFNRDPNTNPLYSVENLIVSLSKIFEHVLIVGNTALAFSKKIV